MSVGEATGDQLAADCPPDPIVLTGAEVDVSVSGMVSVPVWTEDCELVYLLVTGDENHVAGESEGPIGVEDDHGAEFQLTTVGHVLPDGAVAAGPFPGPVSTSKPEGCCDGAAIGSGSGVVGGSWHEIDASNPTCCLLLIETTIGDVPVPAGLGKTMTFDCPVEVTGLVMQPGPDGQTCSVDDVSITGLRRA